MNPAEFRKLVDGMSSDEIISAAIGCGLLENKDVRVGDEVVIPRWLAEILIEQGVAEKVEAST